MVDMAETKPPICTSNALMKTIFLILAILLSLARLATAQTNETDLTDDEAAADD